MMQIRAIVFDLDGVLISTEVLQYSAWVEALNAYGVVLSKKAYVDLAGRQSDLIALDLVGQHRMRCDPQQLLEAKRIALRRLLRSTTLVLQPHAKETVQELGNRFPLALATGGSHRETNLKLEQVGLAACFLTVVTRSDVKRGKPFPDIYVTAVERLGLPPHECVAIEDTQHGVAAARAAGLACIAVPGEYSANQDFRGADRVFKSLKDVAACLLSELS